MTKFNTTAITAAVLAALAAGDAFETQLTTLQKLLKGADRPTVHGIVCPIVAAKYNEAFVDGKWADSDCACEADGNDAQGHGCKGAQCNYRRCQSGTQVSGTVCPTSMHRRRCWVWPVFHFVSN